MKNAWLDQAFGAQAVQKEGIIRRKIKDVEKYASLAALLEYCREEHYHLIETGDQYVVICNPGVLQIHC